MADISLKGTLWYLAVGPNRSECGCVTLCPRIRPEERILYCHLATSQSTRDLQVIDEVRIGS